jgi:glutamyl/glutaminyl-tRNA synthetase
LSEYDTDQYSREKLEQIVTSTRDGIACLSEIAGAAKFFFANTVEIPQDLQESLLEKEISRKILDQVLAKLKNFPWDSVAGCKTAIEEIGKELSIKGKDLYWPIRLALTGDVHGPDLGSILSILGPTRVEPRIKSALQLGSAV